jgi:hypothetical protein
MGDEDMSVGERLARIEAKLDLIASSHESRLNRLENGVVGVAVALLLAVFSGILGLVFMKRGI